MKGKILTIAGIVLIFGYFIAESFRNPSDPTQIVMIGDDTLGRDWGAMAEQKLKEASDAVTQKNEDEQTAITANSFYNATPLVKENEDPYSREKLNSSNYSTIQDGSGKEVIVGYNRPEEQVDNDNYQTRHQKERNQTNNNQTENNPITEPEIKYRD
jgi:hypothetical protein